MTDKTRNELLADIVNEVGGTVTDPHNRNELLRDWLRAYVGNEWRLNLNGSTGYGVFPAMAMAGDFRVSFEASATATNSTFIAGATRAEDEILVDFVGGEVRFVGYTGVTLEPVLTLTPSDPTDMVIEVSRIGSTATLTVDGVSTSATWGANPNASVGFMGQRSDGGNRLTGFVSNLLIEDLAGGETRRYPINSPGATFQPNTLGADGPELANPTEILQFTGVFQSIVTVPGVLEADKWYRCCYEVVSGPAGGGVRFRAFGADKPFVEPGETLKFISAPDSTSIYYQNNSEAGDYLLHQVSVKSSTAMQLVGVDVSDWQNVWEGLTP